MDIPDRGGSDKPLTRNIPLPLTSFVGREREILQLKELLTTTRLLTITGAGGSGKTRLALRVATELSAHGVFKDGVWWDALESLTRPDFVTQSVANALGVREVADLQLAETLANYLRFKHLLLVLDNCEHLAMACARLAEQLLTTCPDLTIMTTSREPLGSGAERVWLIPALVLPEPQPRPLIQKLVQSEAIQLFVERARTVQPRFSLSDDNASAVLQVCLRLDGLPLAIELAAALVKVVTVEQIASRLDGRLALLRAGLRTAPPRQQTLRATIDWSHNLLSEPEQILFRRLSIFVGGWTLEAAEAICSGNGIEARNVLELPTRLVDRSLVLVEEREHASRYRFLETIREYADEKLNQARESDSLRTCHVKYFLDWAEQAEHHLLGPKRLVWFNQLQLEYGNLSAALESCLAASDGIESGLRLAGALNHFFAESGNAAQGRHWLEILLTSSSALTVAPAVRAKALYAAGLLASNRGEYTVARQLFQESAAIWKQVGNLQGLAYSLLWLAKVEDSQGDNQKARELSDESTALFRQTEDKWSLAYSLATQWHVYLSEGDEAAMLSRLRESLALFEELGDRWNIYRPIYSLGHFMARLGKHAESRSYFMRFLPLARELDDRWAVAATHMVLGEMAAAEGDHVGAQQFYEQSLAIWKSYGVKRFIARILLDLAQLARDRRDQARATVLFAESLNTALESDPTDPLRHDTIAFCLAGLVAIWSGQGRAQLAARLLGVCRAVWGAIPSGYFFSPFRRFDQTDYDRSFQAVRPRLGESDFTMAFEQGLSMSLEQATEHVWSAIRIAESEDQFRAQNQRQRNGGLTARESEVAILISRGMSNREIAAKLVLAPRTVENHVGNILSKLDLHSRTQIAAWALAQDLKNHP